MDLNKQYVLQLNKDDDVRKRIIDFAIEHNVLFAHISAIGMLENFTLGFWNFQSHRHDFTKFSSPYELTSFLGSISYQKNSYELHAHATFSNHQLQTIGGHFGNGKVAVLMQCIITIISYIKT